METYSPDRHLMLTQIFRSFGALHTEDSFDDSSYPIDYMFHYVYKPTRLKKVGEFDLALDLVGVYSYENVSITGTSQSSIRVKSFGFKFRFKMDGYESVFSIQCFKHNEDKYISLFAIDYDLQKRGHHQLVTHRLIADAANSLLTKTKKLQALYDFIPE